MNGNGSEQDYYKKIDSSLAALRQLIILRDEIYKDLGYKPDFSNNIEKRYVIKLTYNELEISERYYHAILVFNSYRIASDFLNANRSLIEQANELL